MFAAYKQVRDSTAFLYQIAGIMLLWSTTTFFWHLSKVSILTVSKTLVVFMNILNCMAIVYVVGTHKNRNMFKLMGKKIITVFTLNFFAYLALCKTYVKTNG